MLALLVTGGGGQLGRELAALSSEAVSVHAPTSAELDVTSAGAVIEAVTTLAAVSGRAPVVVNAAAYTAVDKAESEPRRAFAVNADAPRVLAAACSSRNVPLIHVSTDYVFQGDASAPYEADSPVGPQGAYGVTKLAGEEAVLGSGARAWIVRTAWMYSVFGANFVKTMVRLESQRDQLSVVDDQRGSPTWAADLARGLVELAGKIVTGAPPPDRVLHCTSAGDTTWRELAQAVFTELGADPSRISPCTTADYPTAAKRPAYSVLSDTTWRAAGLTPMPPWREALSAAFAAHPEGFRS